MIKPWPLIRSEDKGDFRIFSIRADLKTSPRTHKDHEFLVINTRNWVNVIALTPDDEMVMVEQFRQGTDTVELEIPGGVMDDTDPSAVFAGLRELREETGYVGENEQQIGEVYSNPAIMNNTTYTVLVENCRMTYDTQFDSGEDIITRLVPIADIPRLVAENKIRHSLVVVALYHYENWKRSQKS